MKTQRTKASVVEGLFRTSFCTKTSTRFCTECALAPKVHINNNKKRNKITGKM